jgi:Ni/Co efflux regulator RcnB
MNKILLSTIAMAVVLAFSANAAPEAKKDKDAAKPTAEQKTLRKEMVAKYDTNKDGKLDKDERAKISTADKEKMEKAGLHKKHGKKKK